MTENNSINYYETNNSLICFNPKKSTNQKASGEQINQSECRKLMHSNHNTYSIRPTPDDVHLQSFIIGMKEVHQNVQSMIETLIERHGFL